MKLFASVLFLFASVAIANSQTSAPCNMTAKELPAVRGFTLGMPLEKLESRTDRAPQRTDEPGTVTIWKDTFPENERANLERVVLTLFNFKVIKIQVFYKFSDVRFDSPADFAGYVSKALKLPCDDLVKGCVCDGFRASASYFHPEGFLTLTDTDAEKQIEEKRKQANEEKKKAFKP